MTSLLDARVTCWGSLTGTLRALALGPHNTWQALVETDDGRLLQVPAESCMPVREKDGAK